MGFDTIEINLVEKSIFLIFQSTLMLGAIRKFPAPINITQMRSFFGLVKQVSFVFSMKDTMAPFRELRQPSAELKGKGWLLCILWRGPNTLC